MAQQARSSTSTPRRLWHVTVTATGSAVPIADVKLALERLADHHPFLLSARYRDNRAEIRYWEEGADLRSAAARALVMWSDYGELTALPPWEIIGLEVVDQDTHQQRSMDSASVLASVGAGQIQPF